MFVDTDVLVWVERDELGAIKGVYRRPQPGYAEEAMLASDPEVLAFEARG